MERIAIRVLQKPDDRDPNKMLKWFCAALGLSSDGRGSSIEEQILKELAYSARLNRGMSSSELKFDRVIARSTVIYHLNRFIDTGVIVKRGRRYYLRANEMSKVIEEIEYDIVKEMQRMLDTAREFDRMMDLQVRKRKGR